jgi:ElaB/YqjD/DUF883 family membrane-anchored ribosome-binding protein
MAIDWQQAGSGSAATAAQASGQREGLPDRRQRNREAAARYRQRQRDEESQLAARLMAATLERDELLEERQQLTSDLQALLGMEAVQAELHQSMRQVCDPNGPTLAVALAAAEELRVREQTRQMLAVEQAEKEFAGELRQVVSAASREAAAQAALRLLPDDARPLLSASAAAFVDHVQKVQRHIHDLVSAAQRSMRVGDSSGDSSSAATQAGVGSAEEVPAHQATAEAVRQCALLVSTHAAEQDHTPPHTRIATALMPLFLYITHAAQASDCPCVGASQPRQSDAAAGYQQGGSAHPLAAGCGEGEVYVLSGST